MIKNKFVFAVSFVAMMTVCSAWATDPATTSSTSDTVATVHDVYTALSPTSNSDGKNSGIAGVTYVNRMVNSAGSAAQAAEAHAAASGASALAAAASANEAKQSAATANNALSGKFANTSTVKKAIVTTDSKGNVAPVVISDEETGTYITGVTVSDSGAVELSRGTPTAVNNATLTIQKNGTSVGTFTANASSNKTINITVPTGSLASKSTIVNADVADNAAIAQSKIANLTTDLAAKEVVANKLKSTDTTAISDSNKDTLYPTYAKTAAMIDADINALDKSDAAVSGQYVSSVSETDGVISVTRANLPTVNNATLTIQKNGTDVATFTANSSSGATANITVPTKVSELTNDSNYATKSELPTVNNATLTIQKNGTEVGTFTANSSSNKSINITVPTGSLASKSTIANADVATNAAIAQSKIANLTTDLAAKEVVANKLKSTDTTAISDSNKDTLYPTYAKTAAMIDADINALDKSDAAVSGQYVSSVSETDGVISVTRANLPTVNNATLTIKNGATNADIVTFTANASSGATATIPAATASVAGLAKYGQIPSGSATSTEYATIWVE